MSKKFVSVFVALVILISCGAAGVAANDNKQDDYPDIPWTYIGGENGLGEIIFAQGRYITVGYDGIKLSFDLANWETVVYLKDEDQYIHGGWPSIACNENVFIVTGLDGGIYTSSDGQTWVFYERPFDFDVSDIIWDGKNFVAVGQYGRDDFREDARPAGILVSTDGLNWEKIDVEFDMPWGLEHIAYNGNVYVTDGISEIFYSYDLNNWVECDVFNGYNEGIKWVKDRFIATRGFKNILYSFDGIRWSEIKQSWDNTMWACASDGKIFMTVGSNGTIYVSYDGYNWICKTEWGRVDNGFYDIIWTGERFVILGNKSNLTWIPDDIIRIKVNDKYLIMDTAPVIIDGRTLVPIRDVCEALGASVDWDEDTQTVIITCPHELIADKNRDVTFFDELMAYMDEQYPRGTVTNANVILGDSVKFTQAEVQQAVDAVLAKFPDFIDCTLTDLWYDEEKSDREVESYMSNGKGSVNGIKRENVIVLLSNFNTGEQSGDDGFNPNSRYANWNWILIRDSADSPWRVDDWGY